MACAHLAVKRELSEEGVRVEQVAGDLLACREYPAGEREVEAWSDLRHIGGGEVSRDAARRELIAGVEYRGANAITCLTHGRIG